MASDAPSNAGSFVFYIDPAKCAWHDPCITPRTESLTDVLDTPAAGPPAEEVAAPNPALEGERLTLHAA